MRILSRIALVAIAGAVLGEAGLLDGDLRRSGDPRLAVVVVALMAASVAMLALATGAAPPAAHAARRTPRRLLRAGWLLTAAAALVGLGWAMEPPRPALGTVTPFRNDAIAFNECGARLLLAGRDPYVELDVGTCFAALGLGADRTTPLRAGAFAALDRYPTDDELAAAWAARAAGRDGGEFVSRVSYPAGTVLLALPAAALRLDPNLVHLAFLYAAMALILLRAPAGYRPFLLTGLFGAVCLVAFTAGGSSDLLYTLPLVAAWLWRERGWSALALGVAVATKQLAWFFLPFDLLLAWHERGAAAALRRLGLAGAVFAALNAPFVIHDAGAWVAGVTTIFASPTFPLGVGLVALETTGAVPALPSAAHLALMLAAEAGCLLLAFRRRSAAPELGAVLALVPLLVATRSLFSYFFLLPLLAAAGIARLAPRDGSPDAAEVRAAAALCPFALRAGSR